MSQPDLETEGLLQLALENIRQGLIERAAVEGLTPDEVSFAMTIESNRLADREAAAIRRERGE